MILYDGAWAPSPRRVRIVLAEKGLELERVMVDLRAGAHMQPEYLSINPRGTVPCLVLDDGTVLDDSVAISRYIDALHPMPPLFGRDARESAIVENWLRTIDAECYQAVVNVFRNRSPAMVGRALTGIWPVEIAQCPDLVDRGLAMWDVFMDRLESHMIGRVWIATEDFTFADVYALCAIDFGLSSKLSFGERPAVLSWHSRASARPSASA